MSGGIKATVSSTGEYPENSECLKQIKSLGLGSPMSLGYADDDRTVTTTY
jgi:hypothetical protein